MPDRKVAPQYKPIETIDFLLPKKILLSDKLPVHLLNYGEQDILRIDWISKSGKVVEYQDGVSFFALKMLGEGTRKMTSEQLQEAFQQYGAFLEFNNGFDYNTITVYTLSKYLDQILDLLKDMIMEPRFDPADLDVMKNVKIQEIRLNLEKNNVVASQLFRKSLFGNDHPYGRSLDEAQVNEITLDQVKGYYHENLLSNSQLLVSGKIDDSHIQSLQQVFKDLKFNQEVRVDSFEAIVPASIQKDLSDSLQTSIRYGKRLIKMDHPDFIPMMVVNEILGGYFGSRLMKNIREDKGFTYGIHSNVLSLKYEGYFVIGTDVIKENKDDTIREINKEIGILQSELVGAEELETVKNYMLGNLVSSMDTAFDLADKFKRVHLHGLTMDYYHELVQTIHKIEPLTIQELANKYLDTDTFVLVTVG